MTNHERCIEMVDFLRKMSSGEDPSISHDTAMVSLFAWMQIFAYSNFEIDIPAAMTNDDKIMFYAWDTRRYHLEANIIPNQPVELFFRDRDDDFCFCEDWDISTPFPQSIIDKLPLFCGDPND